MSAAEALEHLTPDEWAGWVRGIARCCPDWPHTDHPDERRAVAAGWVPVSAGWHVALWVHPDRPHVAIPGRHRP
jgi:hypothetical protein